MKTFYQNCILFILLLIAVSSAAQVPVLNSYPSSSNVIFLDFDGHTVEGTSWNYGGSLVCEGANLTPAQIISIFNRVAEDYRPFTVNVTTDSTKYYSAPADRRMRVILTTSSSWYGSAGGVAYINSFSWGDNTPCFVFTALLNFNTKQIAEAASHEAGHTLGLRHQAAYDAVCNKTSEYNAGKGSGEIGWAPIMGVGYYQNMTLWNYGANPFGCNAYQDDLSIITSSKNGITFREDDHGNDLSTASVASFTNRALTVGGIIESPNDIDAIRFTLDSTSEFKATAAPYSIGGANDGSNIDLEIELLDQVQKVIGVYNSPTSLSAAIDTLLPAGTYYLRVQGKGNIYAPNYASLGSYNIAASVKPVETLPVHKLQLKGTTDNKQHKLYWEIVADEKVTSQTIEVSTNGNSFQTLATVGIMDRSYNHTPSASLQYYRVSVLFDNGRRHYSNIVALRNDGNSSKPQLMGNIVRGNMRINCPSPCSYTIVDMAGRVIAKGSLQQGVNTISPRFTTNGFYLIQYYNSREITTEKFSKQ